MYAAIAILWFVVAILAFSIVAAGGSPVWIFTGCCATFAAIVNFYLIGRN